MASGAAVTRAPTGWLYNGPSGRVVCLRRCFTTRTKAISKAVARGCIDARASCRVAIAGMIASSRLPNGIASRFVTQQSVILLIAILLAS